MEISFDIGQTCTNITMGVGVGIGCFLFSATIQKVCMVAGLKIEQAQDPAEPFIPSCQRLDKEFKEMVFIAPVLEEIFFRGVLLPNLAYLLTFCFPDLRQSGYGALSLAHLISIIATGVGFGAVHYHEYEKGGVFAASTISLGGIALGITKANYGIFSSIAAHMTQNYLIGLLDKHWPSLLESEREKQFRLKKQA